MGGSYPSAEKRLVYSTAPANWAREKKKDEKRKRERKKRSERNRREEIDERERERFSLVYLFNDIPTPHGLFDVKI